MSPSAQQNLLRIPAWMCAVASALIEVYAINLIVQNTIIKILTMLFICGIEFSKVIFPLLNNMPSPTTTWQSIRRGVAVTFNATVRFAAIALSTACTFILISGDVTNQNKAKFELAKENYYKSAFEEGQTKNNGVIVEREEKITAAKQYRDTKINGYSLDEQNEISRVQSQYDVDYEKVSRSFDDTLSTYGPQAKKGISEAIVAQQTALQASKNTQIIQISERYNRVKSQAETEYDAEVQRINLIYSNITNDSALQTQAEAKALELALIEYPDQDKNPAIQNTVTFISTLFNFSTNNMYELICFLISLLISTISESVIFTFGNSGYRNLGLTPTGGGSSPPTPPTVSP